MPVPVRLCRQLSVIARHAWARGLLKSGLEFTRPGMLLRFTLPSYEHREYRGPGDDWCEMGVTECRRLLPKALRQRIPRKFYQGAPR